MIRPVKPARIPGLCVTVLACSSGPADAPSVNASSVETASASTEASSPPSAWTPPDSKAALFVYREDPDSFAFTPPGTVTRLTDAKTPCSYELPEGGNMYSGREVSSAWRNLEAQAAASASSAFLSPSDLPIAAEVRGGSGGRIAWTPACGGLCVSGPTGAVQLRRVLHTVMVNRRGVCPAS